MEGFSAIIAALIGAAVGSLGAQYLGDRQRRKQVKETSQREVAVRHLVQLQDALESLCFRFTNDERHSTESEAAKEYYLVSSVYVIANALAHKRLLVIEGVYAMLNVFDEVLPKKQTGSYSQQLELALDNLEKAIGTKGEGGVSFYRYERRALADLLLEWDGVWRTLSYSEFALLIGPDQSHPAVKPAIAFLDRLSPEQNKNMMSGALAALELIVKATKDVLAPQIAVSGGLSVGA